MPDRIQPRAEANRITTIVQASLGVGAYPLDVRQVIQELAPTLAPGMELGVVYKDLRSVEGALLRADSGQAWTILVNNAIESLGRRNFTIAHEFGHFLCHRNLRREFHCNKQSIDRFSDPSGPVDLEGEANAFASQLLLPPNIVRRVADAKEVTFESIASLAEEMATSLTAAAIACVTVSSKPIAFVVVREGFVAWGKASKSAFKKGLFFRRGDEVPAGSRFASEFTAGNKKLDAQRVDEVWLPNSPTLESGYYSAKFGDAFVVLDLSPRTEKIPELPF